MTRTLRTLLIVQLLGAAVVGAGAAAAAPAPTPTATAADDVPIPPASITILVDESGSLDDADVRAEQEAAGLIAQSELATDSQVSVVGFGGKTGIAGQSAVDIVCRPTTVAAATDREYLSRCVTGLQRRTAQQGNATDFAAALSQGLDLLASAPADHQKIVFLLTDGKLDVSADPSYGNSAEARAAAGQALLNRYLDTARQLEVQVWPLGFGGDPDQAALDSYARRGSQRTCGPGYPAPRARMAGDAGAVVNSLVEAFRSAQCLGGSGGTPTPLPAGSTRSLAISVPVIATDGSIAVVKRDSRVSVAYLDPRGRLVPKSGELDGSRFQVSGEGGPVEVLRIVNPLPGSWTVRLSSPPGVPDLTVSAQVIWQGAVRSSISLDPPAPAPGAVTTVRITLVTRTDVISDAAALKGLTVRAVLAGEGFGPVEVPVADDGRGPDRPAGDGTFAGQLTIPAAATGPFRVVGTVAGIGIATDQRPFDGQVSSVDPATQITAQLRVEPADTPPGGELTGTLDASNGTGAAARLRLQVTGIDPGTVVSVTPATVDLPASGDRQARFRVQVDPASSLGPALIQVQAVDDRTPTRLYAERQILVDIRVPVPLRDQWWFRIAVLGTLLLVVALLFLARQRRRAARSVAGLTMTLLRGGEPRNQLMAPSGAGDRFRFVIRDEDTPHPRLDAASSGDAAYVARRSGAHVDVALPSGGAVRLQLDQACGLPNGLELAVRDDRPPRRVRQRRPARRPDRPRRRRADPRSGTEGTNPAAVPSTIDAGTPGTAANWTDDDLL